jgi:hypothetical protein
MWLKSQGLPAGTLVSLPSVHASSFIPSLYPTDQRTKPHPPTYTFFPLPLPLIEHTCTKTNRLIFALISISHHHLQT